MAIDTYCVLGLVFFFLFLFARGFRRDRNSPPSPRSLPILGHLHLLKKPLHQSLASISSRYGRILSLRFGSRRVLLVSSAVAAEECFSENDLAFANRPRFLAGKHLGYDYTTVVWASYGSHWRNLRRLITFEILSASRLVSLSGVREDEVGAMVRSIAKDSQIGAGVAVVEMRKRFFELSVNIMMHMVAGKRFYGDNACMKEEGKRFDDIITETFAVSGSTNLADFLSLLRWFGLNWSEKKLIRLQEKRDSFLQDLVDEHRKECSRHSSRDGEEGEETSGKSRKCLIDTLLALQRTNPEEYSDEIIKGIIVVMLSAGSDTSALTLEWAFALLLSNPAALAKARAEIEVNVGGRRVNESDLSNLPYLHAVIEETLRLRPVAPLLPAHESAEDCVVGGFDVPRGTLLLVNVWAIHRDAAVWEEAEAFRPERWLEKEKQGGGRLLAFGMGRRRCPGDGMAIRVVGLALAALLQCFDWEVGEEMEKVDLSEGPGLSMPMAKPLRARCRPNRLLKDLLGFV